MKLVSHATASHHVCCIPFPEADHTIFQLASCLESRIGDGDNINLGQSVADKRTKVFWKGSKGVFTTLQ
jgi:hypothetical protein